MLDSIDGIGNEGKGKCEVSGTIPIEEEKIIGYESNEGSIENSVDVNEENVDYVGNVGISERVNTNEKDNENEILTNNDSMKDNSKNNNLPIFNYYNYNNNKKLSKHNKKEDTHSLEPTQPTLPTSSSAIEESSFKLKCQMCDYEGIEVDLGLHIFEKHSYYLKQLKRDSSDLNVRTDYLVEQIKLQQQEIKN
jgi:hypothetical protein